MVVSLNSRLESNKEERAICSPSSKGSLVSRAPSLEIDRQLRKDVVPLSLAPPLSGLVGHGIALLQCLELATDRTRTHVQWFRGGLVFEAHRLLHHSA